MMIPILEGHFGIFLALLLAAQASARNELVSLWYCIFSQVVSGRLPG